MAEKIAAVEDFLTCPVCLETFKEPVSLGFNHSFCSSCLNNYWDKNNTKNCPVCRRKSSKENVLVNFSLNELCISFSKKLKSETEEGQAVCGKHSAATHIFCLDDSQVFCADCELSQHTGHRLVSIEAAVTDLKEQLRSQLQPLTQKRYQVRAVERQYEEIVLHSGKQVEECERHIRALFNRLHQFLKEEEQSALTALREEQHRQTHTISLHLENIREQLSSLDLSISAVEQHLQLDNMDIITDYRQTRTTARTLITQTNPKLSPGLLINQAKVLGNLGFKVWEKMKGLVHYSPVILDPNTAQEWLCLSDDLTIVRIGDTYQEVPVNPERFSDYDTVLGSEGFTSGTHQWDVEVGDHPEWNIGVVKESVDRKEEDDATSENGYWTLYLESNEYLDVVGNILQLKKRPQKIRVQLDYDNGIVSFYNGDDMGFICSHTHRFTEKIYPYFCIGKARNAKTKYIKIC